MSKKRKKCTKCNGIGKVKCTRCNGKGKEPKSVFCKKTINAWDEINKKYRYKYEGKSWIFRGQPSDDLPLETSLRRKCKFFPENLKDPEEAERLLLREFKRRFHQYTTDIPKTSDSLEWFSIMQHYGAPTRLLDFTYSILIAAYVALEEGPGNCSIWAINADWAVEKSEELFQKSPGRNFFKAPITEENALSFKKIFLRKKPKKFVCPLNPFRLTERLTLQKGVFMCPGDITVTFEKNLRSMRGHNSEDNIIHFVISFDSREWRVAMDSLYNQNITRATLFPGLDGFAKSLQVQPPKLLIKP